MISFHIVSGKWMVGFIIILIIITGKNHFLTHSYNFSLVRT